MVMEFGIWPATLEIRQEGETPVLSASFPYNVTATRSNQGRVRKERFRSGSMGWQVREFQKLQQELSDVISGAMDELAQARRVAEIEDALERRNTHLLVGHDFNRAIADMRSGTLSVAHTPEAVELRAVLPVEGQQPSWVRDAVLAVRGGQLRGVSPGFQVTNQGAERLVPETGDGAALVREILDSTVYEYSLVARPTYPQTTVDTREDRPWRARRESWWY